MGDEATIDEIIDDVDIDKVSLIFCCIPTVFYDGSVWNPENIRKIILLMFGFILKNIKENQNFSYF